MGRIWQWLWDRYGLRYSWVMCAVSAVVVLPVYLVPSIALVAWSNSDHYVAAIALTCVASALIGIGYVTPGDRRIRNAERWAAGFEVDRAAALADTYDFSRRAVACGFASQTIGAGALMVVVGVITESSGSWVLQFGMLGATGGLAVSMIGAHTFGEAALRPVRNALVGDTAIGDSLPRSRPGFAAWSNLAIVAVASGFATFGAILAAVVPGVDENPALCVAIGCALGLGFAVPITVGTGFGPSLQPIRDLADGTARVAGGDYRHRVPVVQDDDLGALAASFNRMQAGLAERQRLQAAFGTYVDPVLAARLLEQGDDVFAGERREVTVMFVDVRDFTPFAEANTAEDTVARLNALFAIVVPAVVDAGGHVNKFLGDGALAVFGAPNELADHADAAVGAAAVILARVAERFGGDLRIGIGINTGVVIAGTIGGGGKLEFTLIGDTVNVAARVEQLTKTTGDAILMTGQTVDGLASRPPGLIDRGSYALKGKSAAVAVFGLGDT